MILEYVKVFVVGGLICVVGQFFLGKTQLSTARILPLFVVAGVVLSALGLYQPLVDFAGAGATVPLTGFGHSLAKGAVEGVDEKGLIGAFSGGLVATAAGVSIALFCGYINALLFNPKTKQ